MIYRREFFRFPNGSIRQSIYRMSEPLYTTAGCDHWLFNEEFCAKERLENSPFCVGCQHKFNILIF